MHTCALISQKQSQEIELKAMDAIGQCLKGNLAATLTLVNDHTV
jgi:hypothetical protein